MRQRVRLGHELETESGRRRKGEGGGSQEGQLGQRERKGKKEGWWEKKNGPG